MVNPFSDVVDAEQITEGGFGAAVRQADRSQRLLALEDTTTLSYGHQVADGLGVIGSELRDNSSKSRL